MATNEIYRPGDKVSLPVPAGTKSGAPLRIGGLNAVAVTDRANPDVAPTTSTGTPNNAYNYGGGNPAGFASCWLDGSHSFVVDFEVTGVGTEVFIVSADNTLTADSAAGANPLFGHALTIKAADAGPLTVRLTN